MTNERAIPEGYMTVGEVAKRMGVVARRIAAKKSAVKIVDNI